LLRRHEPEDAGPFIDFMTDRQNTRYLGFSDEQKTPQGATELLWRVIRSYEGKAPILALAVEDRNSGEYLGSCGLAPLRKGGGAEVFYNVMPAHQGQGLATEVTRALVDYAFTDPFIPLVAAFIWPTNQASRRVAAKSGLSLAGLVDHPDFPDQVERWELARELWQSQRPARAGHLVRVRA
jgi:ribosomal-protein-alanine N-acetyltransferase